MMSMLVYKSNSLMSLENVYEALPIESIYTKTAVCVFE